MKRKKSVFDKEKIKKYIKPTKKKTLLSAVTLIAVIAIAVVTTGQKKSVPALAGRETDIVTRGDINSEITGSASIEPYERYEIIPKVSGDIIFCPYDVGDHVQKGDLLYGFDSSDTDLSIERQRISMQQSQNSYQDALDERDKLSLTAKNSGVISELTIKSGQEVKSGTKIASVNDTTILEVDLPFTQAQINSINIGDSASITSSKHMSSVSGTVTHKSTASYAGSDGSTLYNVTISFSNPGAFYSGMQVGGSVGANVSPGSGTIENSQSGTITAETDGTISKIYYQNGDYVQKGAVIATMTSDTVTDKINDSSLSYRSASLSMQQSEKDLEDYNITSPISGTVITKNSKTGDTIDRTNSTTTMMVIADVSRLKFSLEIDELDISKVAEGQSVSVTCDALPDEEYTGYITKVSVEGTSQNGVTTYSAEVVIDEPGNLRPSMNIDATIIIESAQNVLMVPTTDITTAGGKSYVFVKDGSGSEASKDNNKNKPSDNENKGFAGGENTGTAGDAKGAPSGGARSNIPNPPADGYVAVEVQTGIANEDFTEILSGLSEGQEIYKKSTTSSSSSGMMMGGMGGGPGGGMGGGPSGGMGGGPGGGMR